MSKQPKIISTKLENLLDFAITLGRQDDFQEILRLVSLTANSVFNADITSVIMINPQTQNTIRTIAREGCQVDQQDYQLVQTNVIGWVARYKQSFLSKNIKNDKRFKTYLFNDEKPQSLMCVLLHHDGKSVGYIVTSKNSEKISFNFNDLSLFEKFAALSLPFICNVQKIEEIFKAPLPDATLLSKYEKLGMITDK